MITQLEDGYGSETAFAEAQPKIVQNSGSYNLTPVT